MSFRPLLFLLAACLGAGLPDVCRAQAEGMLVGLRYQAAIERPLPYYAGSADSLLRPVYRTLLLTHQDSTFTVRTAPDVLLIPVEGRFWSVGAKRSVYNNWVEDFVWAAPSGMRPELAGIPAFNGEYCAGHRVQSILYAGPRYLALNQRSAGYCEGAAHPWFFNTLAVVPLDSTTHTGLAIGDVLTPAAYTVFGSRAASHLAGLPPRQRARYNGVPDPANWSPVRRGGRWAVVGRIEGADETERMLTQDLTLPLTLPASMAGLPPADWARVRTFAPDAVDALLAPSGAWMALLRPGQLSLHFVRDGRIGPAVMRRLVPPGAEVVMIRTASGTQLRPWRQHFDRLATR